MILLLNNEWKENKLFWQWTMELWLTGVPSNDGQLGVINVGTVSYQFMFSFKLINQFFYRFGFLKILSTSFFSVEEMKYYQPDSSRLRKIKILIPAFSKGNQWLYTNGHKGSVKWKSQDFVKTEFNF